MPQFFIDKKLQLNEDSEIRGSEAKHISSVLRLKKNDWIVLSDGSGNSFKAKITESELNNVKVRILEKLVRKNTTPPPALAFSIIKHDRTETIIQKSVELGLYKLFPFVSERTIPRLKLELSDNKLKRWNKIAQEAAKQSGLPIKPVVNKPKAFEKVLELSKDFSTTLLFWEGERTRGIKNIKNVIQKNDSKLIIIGPEGGFSEAEIEKAKDFKISTVSLGSQILRVETAVISALSICLYEAGNFDIT